MMYCWTTWIWCMFGWWFFILLMLFPLLSRSLALPQYIKTTKYIILARQFRMLLNCLEIMMSSIFIILIYLMLILMPKTKLSIGFQFIFFVISYSSCSNCLKTCLPIVTCKKNLFLIVCGCSNILTPLRWDINFCM
jgi:hypothetical protein